MIPEIHDSYDSYMQHLFLVILFRSLSLVYPILTNSSDCLKVLPWSFFDNFLIPPLNTAFSFVQIEGVVVGVCYDLENRKDVTFKMAGIWTGDLLGQHVLLTFLERSAFGDN